MSFGTFDASKLVVTYDGQMISGFADGDCVEIDMMADAFSSKAGAGGEVVRAKSNDRRATITIKLYQTARSNDLLTAYHNVDLAGSGSPKALRIFDGNTGSVHIAADAWIKKMPKSGYSADVSVREWVFECAEMNTLILGNAV